MYKPAKPGYYINMNETKPMTVQEQMAFMKKHWEQKALIQGPKMTNAQARAHRLAQVKDPIALPTMEDLYKDC